MWSTNCLSASVSALSVAESRIVWQLQPKRETNGAKRVGEGLTQRAGIVIWLACPLRSRSCKKSHTI